MCVFVVVWLHQRSNSEQSASSAAHWCRTPSQRCKWFLWYCCCCYNRCHYLSILLSQYVCPFHFVCHLFLFLNGKYVCFLLYIFKYRDGTAYFHATTEGLSVAHLMCRRTEGISTTARRCCGVFFVNLVPAIKLQNYLLTYFWSFIIHSSACSCVMAAALHFHHCFGGGQEEIILLYSATAILEV